MIELNFTKDNNKINLKANICDNDILKKYMKVEYFTNLCKDGIIIQTTHAHLIVLNLQII